MSADPQPFAHLYLHVPFCRHKCGYCDFNAYAGMDRLMTPYVDAMLRELDAAARRHRFASLATIYLGGGTPSLLAAAEARRLLDGVAGIFEIAADAEITFEANPASTDAARLEAWREGGVTRLSLGVQGFDKRALAVLERRTDGAQAEGAFRLAREAGFENISLDLIYGVPHQTPGSWLETVRRAVALQPEHLSCYCLSFEEGTLLHRRRERGLLPEVDSDLQADQLALAGQELAGAGFIRYEVSSWSRPGRRSRHNQAYWACRPVYGAGAGAHSYATDGMTAWRWWNIARPGRYIEAAPEVREDGEELPPRQAAGEALMLGLRWVEGVAAPAGFERQLELLSAQGLVDLAEERVRPTERGLDLHNQIALAVL